MNIRQLLCLVSALALATSAAAQTQSLSQLAKQEKQRREKMRKAGGPAKLYTEADRSGTAGDPVTEATTGEATPAAAGSKKKEKTPEELTAAAATQWNEKLKKAQDDIKELEGIIAKNERSLASMYNITPARADLANGIEADKKRLADLKQSLVTLEDERRRAGLPRPR